MSELCIGCGSNKTNIGLRLLCPRSTAGTSFESRNMFTFIAACVVMTAPAWHRKKAKRRDVKQKNLLECHISNTHWWVHAIHLCKERVLSIRQESRHWSCVADVHSPKGKAYVQTVATTPIACSTLQCCTACGILLKQIILEQN